MPSDVLKRPKALEGVLKRCWALGIGWRASPDLQGMSSQGAAAAARTSRPVARWRLCGHKPPRPRQCRLRPLVRRPTPSRSGFGTG
eukprot:5349381-Alexandrium_andersonii.AAC.1